MAMVTAWNTQTNQEQQVPAHWVGNPHLFAGIFRPLSERDAAPVARVAAPKPARKPTKKSRRQAGAVETPTAEAAVPTELNPEPVGELDNEEYSHGE